MMGSTALLQQRSLLLSALVPTPSIGARRLLGSHFLDAIRGAGDPILPPRSTAVQLTSRRATTSGGADGAMDERARAQCVMAEAKSGSDGWEECWKEGLTPWDVGSATPVVVDLVARGVLPLGRALVPGCGSGHDVFALAAPDRRAVGLDVSSTANALARRRAAADGAKSPFVDFVVADFFQYSAEGEPFDLVLDYTFFCAIDPVLRPAWAAKVAELLAPRGELLTLMFPVDEFEGGPPYAVSVGAYERVLHPHGFALTSCVDNELAVGARKGREKVGRWVRPTPPSKF